MRKFLIVIYMQKDFIDSSLGTPAAPETMQSCQIQEEEKA